jgi:hypothetical protein
MSDFKNIKVWWEDAVLYSRETPNKNSLKPTKMLTEGILVKDDKTCVVVQRPRTIYKSSRQRAPKGEGATFIFIPRGMIVKIEKI